MFFFFQFEGSDVLLKLFWLLPHTLPRLFVLAFFLDTHLYVAHVLKLRQVIAIASDGVGNVC